MTAPDTPAIAGAYETADRAEIPDVALADLHILAALHAIEASGLRPRDVDGIACGTAPPGAVASQLGISPRWVDGTSLPGCGTLVQLRRAVAAIAAGFAATIVVVLAPQSQAIAPARKS